MGSFYSYAQADAAAPAGLDPGKWVPLKLTQVTPLTNNTAIYRFAFSNPDASSGMTVASCLLTKAAIGSQKPDGSRANVMRPYTPISRPDQTGYLELAVKSYPEGKMSKHIASLAPGDTLDFKGPILKLAYTANQYDTIGMVAGGTGIAPMLQVVDEILTNPSDKTKVSLIFGNISETDILLKEAIDARANAHPDRFSVFYVVDTPPQRQFWQTAWPGGVGYVTKAMLAEKMPPPSDHSMVMVCGPPPMYKAVCGSKGTPEDPKAQGELGGLLKEMGYSSKSVFKF
eukprot:CAMPEP_0119329352 /NCGR_PEP_ID=MMETSP1333-20130426/75629_1 /TAXON_ID=418940 /ORGANISM="Scyphosphaera apsteinii, Strain RCC1455" /LENGTH=285 /DNA_ID=CAMNT_0007338449 /DNA_START=74 /DNA_END=931 /DNA_ORIENTATION=-